MRRSGWIILGLLLIPVGVARGQAGPEVTDAKPSATQPVATTQLSDVDNVLLRIATGGDGQLRVDDLYNVGFWLDFGKDAVYWAVGFVPRLIIAVFLLLFFWVIYRVVRKMLVGGMRAAGMDPSICDMLGQTLRWLILGFGFIIAGNQIGIQIAALLTGVSIIGLAVGFAAQESISNFIAGVMIFWDKPFKPGDWIEIENHLAQVKRVTFRSTRLENLDGDVVIIPNTKMLSETVINKTTNPVTRCNVPIGIAYKENISQAREILLRIVAEDPRIEKKPEPEVVVKSLNASSVDLMLHFWIREEKYEDAMQYEYMERGKVALDAAGIEIPYPHLQLFLENTPALEKLALRGPKAA